jgi:flagellar basal body P-ring formation protein FlgA
MMRCLLNPRRRLAVLSLIVLLGMGPVEAPAGPDALDPWLSEISLLLDDHFQPDGRLELAWARMRSAANEPAPLGVLELISPPSQLARQMVVRLRLTPLEGDVSHHQFIVVAQLWQQGWELKEPAPSRSPLRPSIVAPRMFDALRHRGVLVSDLALEFDFARSLPAGRLLTWRDVVRRPLVRRNDPLEVIAHDGGLSVSLRAIALHDAARGESVRVRNPDSRKEFTAIVSDHARAYVHF